MRGKWNGNFSDRELLISDGADAVRVTLDAVGEESRDADHGSRTTGEGALATPGPDYFMTVPWS